MDRRCPHCRFELKGNDKTCPLCGSQLDVVRGGGDSFVPPPPSPVENPSTGEVDSTPWTPPRSEGDSANDMAGTPPKYTVQAILCLLFCCLPFAIPGIVYSEKIPGLMAKGDVEGAWRASRLARNWVLASFLSVLIPTVLMVIISMILSVSSGELDFLN